MDKIVTPRFKEILEYGGGLLVVLSLVLFPAGIAGGDTWSGSGQADLFPQGSTSKNYIVKADIKVATKWWWRKDYVIESVTWPNGETDTFSHCTVHGPEPSRCLDSNSDETYTVTVEQAPDRPTKDNS